MLNVTRAQALTDLGRWLQREDYRFATITPESHRRVNARTENAEARSLSDIFGWSRKFRPEVLGAAGMSLLERADALNVNGTFCSSKVRFSTAGESIFVHSAFPCLGADSVFFGPDTYRFLRFIDASRPQILPRRIIDIGAGSGAAGIHLARLYPRAEVFLTDVNDTALEFARANATLNNCARIAVLHSDVLQDVDGPFDLVVSNPPYLVDAIGRTYRDGGGALGHDLSLRILTESLAHLSPLGQILLYTGSAIVNGRDIFREKAMAILAQSGRAYSYAEIDPDVFGEELDTPAYIHADRLAVVGLHVTARTGF
jgi:release factor glutamine methyltransferase